MTKSKGGRPTLYKNQFCDQLITHMSQGLSFDTFAGVIGTCRDTLYEWVKKHPKFSDAKARATAKRNLFVETMYLSAAIGRTVKDNDGNVLKPQPAMLIYWTKNTLGWKEAVEHSVDEKSALTLKYNLNE